MARNLLERVSLSHVPQTDQRVPGSYMLAQNPLDLTAGPFWWRGKDPDTAPRGKGRGGGGAMNLRAIAHPLPL